MNFWVYYIVVRECENVVCIISTFRKLAGFSLQPNIDQFLLMFYAI